jgi:serine kinase of HPr protein (carbohydrate metabolism regulator)
VSGAVHATAVVVGTRGLLLVGPSGSGKSRLALALIAEAQSQGQFGTLVADDRIFLERHGDTIVARRPESISGLIEIRGTGIGHFHSIEKAVMHLAIRPVSINASERLPPENETYEIDGGFRLPLVRLQHDLQAPFSALMALLLANSSLQR